ncbi:hypothetical protein GCM10011583_65430 [Streptomyces camponoticapitis]|uniref:DUF4350 domain-containing protein n=1 Tax=Streptomyces camponoticapitis TaxID=1616125 RepID=A0ABQ2ESK3_9ACTN|nr:DUF4350 domain-containing protein [Streptomyces camponoticapitis]GGK24364.1 hypothetical protein GCM10011583_65430 [Streptomyces camponoticapitis]
MTGTGTGAPARPMTSPTSMSPSAQQVWKRVRGLLLALAILLVAGIALAAVRSGDQHGRLDPRSADPLGSRAVAELLKDRGVSTRVVTTLADATAGTGPDTTLVVTSPNLLTFHQQRTLQTATELSGGRTVLLSPGPPSVGTLAPGVTSTTETPVAAKDPRCSLQAARDAGTVDIGGHRYTADSPDSDACYPTEGRPSLLRVDTPANGDTVLLGSPDLLYNERLAKQGNASLALQLLGSRPHIVWYLPSLSDPSATESGSGIGSGNDSGNGDDSGDSTGGEEDQDGADNESSFLDLIPSGWLWGTLQLALAAVLAAVWRSRRLGPVVAERLPVAIRASEATEGRARLYRKANARDRAASVLRTETRTRLASLLGVPPSEAHTPETLVPAVSAQLPDDSRDLRTLLFGPAPADDAALIRLTDQLDALEREVRTS